MNEVLAISFLAIGIVMLLKKLVLPLVEWVLTTNLKLLGVLGIILGLFFMSVSDFAWSDRLWKSTLFIIGILSILRGLIVIFFEDFFRKVFVSWYKENYYKVAIRAYL